jgi:outer membrane biosynthesis protein TonB
MSAKAKKPAPKATKAAPAKAAKAEPKKSAKQLKEEALEAEANAILAKAAGNDEDAEEEEDAKSSSASAGGNAAALAAVTGSTEMSASFKNFRHHPDMENFYRFIYENDLRLEALAIINDMMTERANRKAVRSAKANAH